jgi:hypothetical protein
MLHYSVRNQVNLEWLPSAVTDKGNACERQPIEEHSKQVFHAEYCPKVSLCNTEYKWESTQLGRRNALHKIQ